MEIREILAIRWLLRHGVSQVSDSITVPIRSWQGEWLSSIDLIYNLFIYYSHLLTIDYSFPPTECHNLQAESRPFLFGFWKTPEFQTPPNS